MRVQYNFSLLFSSLLFSSLLLVPSSVFATSVISTAPGGDPTTAYQATAPTFADGDTIRGHAMFKAGFIIPASATVTWDGDGVVNGPITFSDGTSLAVTEYAQTGKLDVSYHNEVEENDDE